MRVLLVNQFYPPDMAPTGQHLHDLARCLVMRGHIVRVLCSRRSYDGEGRYAAEETMDGVHVHRVSTLGFGRRGITRLADYISFHLAVFLHVKRYVERSDLAVCLTTPPYIGWTVRRALGRHVARMVHWVMDAYPDVLAAHGGLCSSGIGYRMLEGLTRLQLDGAVLVLALGPRMRNRVARYATSDTRLEWVSLWGTPPEDTVDMAAPALWRKRLDSLQNSSTALSAKGCPMP